MWQRIYHRRLQQRAKDVHRPASISKAVVHVVLLRVTYLAASLLPQAAQYLPPVSFTVHLIKARRFRDNN